LGAFQKVHGDGETAEECKHWIGKRNVVEKEGRQTKHKLVAFSKKKNKMLRRLRFFGRIDQR
jgi:hypothetical protein